MVVKRDTPSLSDLTKKDVPDKVEAPEVPDSEAHADEVKTEEEANAETKTSEVVVNKTPNELAAETPKESAARYGVDMTVTETDEKNPRVEYSESDYMTQVPSGTHLHPDIAKDLANRGISAPTTDNAQIRKGDTFMGYDFADDPVVEMGTAEVVEDEEEERNKPALFQSPFDKPVVDRVK